MNVIIVVARKKKETKDLERRRAEKKRNFSIGKNLNKNRNTIDRLPHAKTTTFERFVRV
jgi:hypothetical protein